MRDPTHFFFTISDVLVDPSIWPQPGERTGQADCDTNTGYRAMDRRETRYRVTDGKDTHLYSLF